MDLNAFFYNQERIADALERIALSLEIRSDDNQTDYASDAAQQTAPAAQPAQAEKPKRTRRTKAEIDAERNGTTAQPLPEVMLNPPMPLPATPAPMPAMPAMPATPAPAPAPAPAPEQQTVRLEPPFTIAAVQEDVASMTTPQQFSALYREVVPVFNIARDQFVAMFSDYGLQMPLSDPDDPSKPGAAYAALDNATRVSIHQAAVEVATRAKAHAAS